MEEARETVTALYGALLEEGGRDFEITAWEAPGLVPLRFEALLQALAPHDLTPTTRVLDMGCGLGDLYGYLERTGRPVDYHGVDLTPGMIERARERYPKARFTVGDMLTFEPEAPYDLVICAGGLSVIFGTPEQNWRAIERLFACCRWAASFSVLSEQGPDHGANALRRELWVVSAAELRRRLRPLTPHLAVREDVLPADAIVTLYRPEYCREARLIAARGLSNDLDQAEIAIHRQAHRHALELLAGARESPRALTLAATAHAHLEELDDATVLLERALELDPVDLDALRALFYLDAGLGRIERATRLLERAATAGESATGRDEMRAALHERCLQRKALDDASALEDSAETPPGRAWMQGVRALAGGDLATAEQTLTSVRSARPFDVTPSLKLATVYHKQKRPALAIAEAARVLLTSPRHLIARTIAADALQALAADLRAPERAEAARDALHPLAAHPVLGATVRRLLLDPGDDDR